MNNNYAGRLFLTFLPEVALSVVCVLCVELSETEL